MLYLGLELPEKLKHSKSVIHYPIIKIVPRPHCTPEIQHAFKKLHLYTHFVFTSKTAVKLFCTLLPHFNYKTDDLKSACCIAVGSATAALLAKESLPVTFVAEEECAEGIVKLLEKMPLKNAHFFWPHAAISRPILSNYFAQNKIQNNSCILYDTIANKLNFLPNFDEINEIFFTSPSTVDAFIQIFGKIPKDKKITAIGSITQNYLNNINKF